MFVGCSEISISVIVKYMQDIGIISAFCLPGRDFLSFSVPGGQKKVLGCGLPEGSCTVAVKIFLVELNASVKSVTLLNLDKV